MTFDDDDDFTSEFHERRIVRCKSCRARIIFLTTAAGKKIPCEADSVDPDDQTFEANRHETHFASCPGAAQFRKGS